MNEALTPELTIGLAARFAKAALGHVTREWPNKLDHVMAGPDDVKGPRALHPIFFGSYDWHSCVHGHWLLARLYRKFPDLQEARAIRALLDDQFTAKKVEGELAYLAAPHSRGFERPYGWAWLLMLQGELARHTTAEGKKWASALAPLAQAFKQRFVDYFPLATYPVRVGTHGNSAFALALSLSFARAMNDMEFETLCFEKALTWYAQDADCQAWEPSQDEFLSPALMEAGLMSLVLPSGEFEAWFGRFLPRTAHREPHTLFAPASVSDRSDGKIAHLDGLNLSRAWCWRLIAHTRNLDDAASDAALSAAQSHLACALDHVIGDYMGEHWLASFALLALDCVPD